MGCFLRIRSILEEDVSKSVSTVVYRLRNGIEIIFLQLQNIGRNHDQRACFSVYMDGLRYITQTSSFHGALRCKLLLGIGIMSFT